MTGQMPGNLRTTTNFYYSFSFLPPEKRHAVRTVYGFCRKTDDLVDNFSDPAEKLTRLTEWRSALEQLPRGNASDPLLAALGDTARKYDIPFRHFIDLLDGVEMDIGKSRYGTFAELTKYCELVASSVGLMCINIFGLRNERTEEYARTLGIALQLTNIIRDVGVDADYGRIYIPTDEMQRFGCSDEDILGRVYSERFGELMAYQAARAEEFYSRAGAVLHTVDRPAMYPAMIMEKVYAGTLERIRRSRYRVFGQPFRLPKWRQFLIAAPYIIAMKFRPR